MDQSILNSIQKESVQFASFLATAAVNGLIPYVDQNTLSEIKCYPSKNNIGKDLSKKLEGHRQVDENDREYHVIELPQHLKGHVINTVDVNIMSRMTQSEEHLPKNAVDIIESEYTEDEEYQQFLAHLRFVRECTAEQLEIGIERFQFYAPFNKKEKVTLPQDGEIIEFQTEVTSDGVQGQIIISTDRALADKLTRTYSLEVTGGESPFNNPAPTWIHAVNNEDIYCVLYPEKGEDLKQYILLHTESQEEPQQEHESIFQRAENAPSTSQDPEIDNPLGEQFGNNTAQNNP